MLGTLAARCQVSAGPPATAAAPAKAALPGPGPRGRLGWPGPWGPGGWRGVHVELALG
jgi:hypothetical protein